MLEYFRLGFLRLFHSPMSAKMPVKQFGHAGLKWVDFELLSHSGYIFFFFTCSSRNCLQFHWSWIKIILLSQCGKQRKCETKGVESKHIVNLPSYYKLSLRISVLFKCFIKELWNLMSLVLFALRICVFFSFQGHGTGISHGSKKGGCFFSGVNFLAW